MRGREVSEEFESANRGVPPPKDDDPEVLRFVEVLGSMEWVRRISDRFPGRRYGSGERKRRITKRIAIELDESFKQKVLAPCIRALAWYVVFGKRILERQHIIRRHIEQLSDEIEQRKSTTLSSRDAATRLKRLKEEREAWRFLRNPLEMAHKSGQKVSPRGQTTLPKIARLMVGTLQSNFPFYGGSRYQIVAEIFRQCELFTRPFKSSEADRETIRKMLSRLDD